MLLSYVESSVNNLIITPNMLYILLLPQTHNLTRVIINSLQEEEEEEKWQRRASAECYDCEFIKQFPNPFPFLCSRN